VMDIYIIHEFDIVKIIYVKNTASHGFKKLISFASPGPGLPLAVNE
jgi:hypothetical protein